MVSISATREPTPLIAARRPIRIRPLWLALPGLTFLLVFLIYPSAQLLSLSLTDAEGGWSISAFQRIFRVGVYLRVLSTTFSIALQTTVLCLLLGYPVAYWLSRLSGRQQRLATLLVLLPFWTSALVKNFAWLVLLGRTGALASLMAWFGLPPIDFLFGRGAVVFGMTHTMLPLAIISMLPTMNRIDARLPLAAGTLGAAGIRAFWRIFFQLSMPGVAAAALLVFIGGLGFFITPALLGGAQDTMLAQIIINQINQLQNWQFGAAISALLVGSALLTCLLFDQVFGLSAVTGGETRRRSKGGGRRAGMWLLGLAADGFSALAEWLAALFNGHRFGWLLPFYAISVITLLILPIIALIPMGFTSGKFLSFPPPGYGLGWFRDYFNSPVWMAATLRSYAVGFLTAALTLIITLPAAFGLVKSRSRTRSLVFLLFLTPMVVPSIVVAIALFYLFAHMSLVATDAGIVIGHTVMAIPVAFVILITTLKNYDWQFDHAAATLGANRA